MVICSGPDIPPPPPQTIPTTIRLESLVVCWRGGRNAVISQTCTTKPNEGGSWCTHDLRPFPPTRVILILLSIRPCWPEHGWLSLLLVSGACPSRGRAAGESVRVVATDLAFFLSSWCFGPSTTHTSCFWRRNSASTLTRGRRGEGRGIGEKLRIQGDSCAGTLNIV